MAYTRQLSAFSHEKDYIHGEMKRWKKCKDLVEHPWFPELVQLARLDNMGRVANYNPNYSRQDIIDKLNKAVRDHWSGEDPFPLKEESNVSSK